MKLSGKVAQKSLLDIGKEPVADDGRKAPRIWVITADGHIVRILRKTNGHLEQIGEAVPEESALGLTNKSVGRVISSGAGTLHHKYEPHMNESQQEAVAFARQISEWLEDAVRKDAFDQLILVAAPHMLGDLRKTLSKHVCNRITAEIDKDLTKHDAITLQKELTKVGKL